MHAGTIETALERVLKSTAFRRAPRQRRFLEYVVLETLAGNGDRLKEYAVGVSVFERGADFDPRIDTIVRVEAIKIRERLHAYYRTEGATDPLVISIPKGSYRAIFQVHEDQPAAIFDDPEAVYWQAKSLLLQFAPETHGRARRLFALGVARWPNDARLYSGLAEAVAGSTCSDIRFLAPDEGVPLMQWAARQALKLDPSRGEAHLYANLAAVRRPDKSAVIEAARRALALAPQDANLHQWGAAMLLSAGKLEEALLHMRQAARLQPGALIHRTFTATLLFAARRTDAAIGHFRDILAIDPTNYCANFWLSRALCTAGRFDEAMAAASRAHSAASTVQTLEMLGYAQARAGDGAAAKKVLAVLKQRSKDYYVPRSALAAINIALGRFDIAAAEMAAALEEGDFTLGWAKLDSRFAPLAGKVVRF